MIDKTNDILIGYNILKSNLDKYTLIIKIGKNRALIMHDNFVRKHMKIYYETIKWLNISSEEKEPTN